MRTHLSMLQNFAVTSSFITLVLTGTIRQQDIEPVSQSLVVRSDAPQALSKVLSTVDSPGSGLHPQIEGPRVALATALSIPAVEITKAVCTTIGSFGLPGAVGCAATGIVSLLGLFFLGFTGSGKRDVSSNVWNTIYLPTAEQSAVQQLHTLEPEGDWRSIGNATIDGIFHDLHYRRNGSVAGLRAMQYPSHGLSTRSEDDFGGVVVDYHWNDANRAAYDDFGSNQGYIDGTAQLWAQELQNLDANVECASWYDDAGLLNSGVLTVGWNDQPWQFADGEPAGYLQTCDGNLNGQVPSEDHCTAQ